MFGKNQNRLTLQFHITGRCNLRCKHCYRTEGDVEKLTYNDIISVIDQFIILREKYNLQNDIKKRGHINLTGGEPFFRKDIKDIIRYIDKHNSQITYGVLSNGSFIDEEMLNLLRETHVSFVQLSIDGDKKTHDFLRTQGDYTRVLNMAGLLENSGIRTHISFTANKENYRLIPAVADACRKKHVTKFWSDRLVPIGNGEELKQLQITDDELRSYIHSLKKAQGSTFKNFLYKDTQITMNRALQFIGSKGAVYSCSAGKSLITVDELGNVLPCRRMPIICGNIYTSTLDDVYFNSQTFKDLQKEYVPEECALCEYSFLCNGGAKCQSYAIYGSYKKADPACFLRHKID